MPRNTNDFKAKLTVTHRRIAQWYKAYGRHHLPWRQQSNPYHVYISEVMLQQTQVKTVLERYYFPFLKRFPTLAALAKAPLQEVLKAWEGLGYYTRARNLHKAAQQVVNAGTEYPEEFSTTTPQGVNSRSEEGKAFPLMYNQRGAQPWRRLSKNYNLPDTVEGLLALPGIGRNTAHAVACFGFGAAVPVMEANVKRVLARVFAMKTLDEKALWQHAGALLDTKNAFDYNQAMMDIGSLVCTKRAPRCGDCPLAGVCKGRQSPESYPIPKTAKAEKIRQRVIVVFQDAKGRVYVKQRTSRFLGGLWGFLEYETAPVLKAAALLGQVRQVYSHFTLEAKVLLCKVKVPPEVGGRWVAPGKLGVLPLSRADQKVVRLLAESMTGFLV